MVVTHQSEAYKFLSTSSCKLTPELLNSKFLSQCLVQICTLSLNKTMSIFTTKIKTKIVTQAQAANQLTKLILLSSQVSHLVITLVQLNSESVKSTRTNAQRASRAMAKLPLLSFSLMNCITLIKICAIFTPKRFLIDSKMIN